jgi:hypothetical protein
VVSEREQPDLRRRRTRWSRDLELLRQNDLLSESRFLSFAKDRGISVHGTSKGDPGEFHKRGWLAADAEDESRQPQFHPFRIYPLLGILKSYRRPLTVTLDTRSEDAAAFVARFVESLPSVEQIRLRAREWNETSDLAILLEPLYWPRVVGRLTRSGLIDDEVYEVQANGTCQAE